MRASCMRKTSRRLPGWKPGAQLQKEISFAPARVLLQDFTGVPCVVDLAAMRDGMIRLGGNPDRVNPLQPVELVIDHSVQVDYFGRQRRVPAERRARVRPQPRALFVSAMGTGRLQKFPCRPAGHRHRPSGQRRVSRPGRVSRDVERQKCARIPDTLVGTDSHTTMVNGLGVLGWGVGGIEAEAAMLGQPMSMLIPPVLGFRLTARCRRARRRQTWC